MHLETTSSTGKLDNGVLGSNLVHGSTGVLASGVTVHLHELGKVEAGLLEDLNLADEGVLKREDAVALLLDLGTHSLGVGDPVVIKS